MAPSSTIMAHTVFIFALALVLPLSSLAEIAPSVLQTMPKLCYIMETTLDFAFDCVAENETHIVDTRGVLEIANLPFPAPFGSSRTFAIYVSSHFYIYKCNLNDSID